MSAAVADRFDAIVVGAGLAGLTAAARLAREGVDTLLIERNDDVGGNAGVIRKDGFVFDRALHQVYGMGRPGSSSNRILEQLGVLDRVEFLPVDNLLRVYFPKFEFSFPIDIDDLEQALLTEFPDSAQEIATELGRVREVLELVRVVRRENPDTTPDGRTSPLRKLIGAAKGTWHLAALTRYRSATFERLCLDRVSDPRLRLVLGSLWGYLGLPPDRIPALLMAAMLGLYHDEGAFYVKGSSGRLSGALAEAVREAGGVVLTGATVDQVKVDEQGVTGVVLDDGRELSARCVVHAGDVRRLYGSMLPAESVPPRYKARVDDMVVSLGPLRLLLGVEWDWGDQPPPFEAAYCSNADHTADFEALLRDDPATFFVTIPTLLDPNLAPAGCQILIVTTLTPPHDEAYWDANTERRADEVIERLNEVYPGIREAIRVREVITPANLKRRTLVSDGAMYGWQNTTRQVMWRRLPQKTPLRGLFLAGHWTQPGSSMPLSMKSGFDAGKLAMSYLG